MASGGIQVGFVLVFDHMCPKILAPGENSSYRLNYSALTALKEVYQRAREGVEETLG